MRLKEEVKGIYMGGGVVEGTGDLGVGEGGEGDARIREQLSISKTTRVRDGNVC